VSHDTVKEVYAKAKQAGLGDKDFSAIFDFIGLNT
jgi:3-hydroxyisobutyrate dehydrogenase-like beta-hydroxyacid dehydrogenase